MPRSLIRWSVVVAGLLLAPGLTPDALLAQVIRDPRLPAPTARIELSGPRFGVTWLDAGMQRKLADRDISVSPMISQFGWQFERHFVGANEPVSPVMEFVVLVGGLDQGVFLPSLTWIVGLRSRAGAEFGVGPNLTPSGAALALAAGVTVRQRTFHIPLHVAVVPSAAGARVSLLTGFNMR